MMDWVFELLLKLFWNRRVRLSRFMLFCNEFSWVSWWGDWLFLFEKRHHTLLIPFLRTLNLLLEQITLNNAVLFRDSIHFSGFWLRSRSWWIWSFMLRFLSLAHLARCKILTFWSFVCWDLHFINTLFTNRGLMRSLNHIEKVRYVWRLKILLLV